MVELSKTQQQAVDHTDGAMLVLASAGSGKTRVLIERIKRLAPRTRRGILALTFTNMASEEMKQRLREASEEIAEKVEVGTFHTFCLRVLQSHGSAIGFKNGTQIFSERKDLVSIAMSALSLMPETYQVFCGLDQKQKNSRLSELISLVSTIKRNLISTEDLRRTRSEEDVQFYENYNNILYNQNAVDYDDLLFKTYELFTSRPAIAALYRRSYEYICIDEAQDLNKAQYMVLRALTGDEHKQVMMVGDPKQSIYAFNDASSDFMTKNFVEDYAPVTQYQLNENFRSAKKIVDYANKIFPSAKAEPNMWYDGYLEEFPFQTDNEETEWVAGLVERALAKKNSKYYEGELTPERICVLARNQYLLLPVEEALKQKGIKTYYKTTSKRFEFVSDVAVAFNLAMMMHINPSDKLHDEQLKKRTGCRWTEDIENAKNVMLASVLTNVKTLEDDGSNLRRVIKNVQNVIASANTLSDDERNEAFNEMSAIEKLWLDFCRVTSTPTIQTFHNAAALGQTFRVEEERGVALSTVHTMKGQEKDVVFLIGMDQGTFPDYRAVNAGAKALAEEKNNLYVAVTRARRMLFISYPLNRTMPWGGTKQRLKSQLLPKETE